MSSRLLPLLGLLSLMLLAAPLAAQDGAMESDRPGFATGPAVMAPGRFQLEVGSQFAFDGLGQDHLRSDLPQLDLRIGIAEFWELDLLWSGVAFLDQPQGSSRQANDVALAVKRYLGNTAFGRASLFAAANLPSGGDLVGSPHVNPTLGLLWDRPLAENLAVFSNLLLQSVLNAGSRDQHLQPALGLSWSLPAGWGSFVELYGDVPLDGPGKPQSVVDAGLTWALQANLQFDLSFGIALDAQSSDFLSFGFTTRF